MGYTTAIGDMVVTDTNAPSYHHMRLEKDLAQHEVEKKKKCLAVFLEQL